MDKDSSDLSYTVIHDLTQRMREIELNIPPRVHALETSLNEIRRDFSAMRREHQAAAKENRDALNAFRDRLDTDSRENTTAIAQLARENRENNAEIVNTIRGLSRKISFFQGAMWALIGIAGIIAYYHQELGTVLRYINQQMGA